MPKGFGREAVLAALNENPEATKTQLAEMTDLGVRHVQKTLKAEKERQKKR